MNGRLIAIGDIHGCADEFEDLLDRLEAGPDDRIVLLGDLVNRGPQSRRVIDLARRCRAVPLLGNHEARLLRYHRTADARILREQDLRTAGELRPEDWSYLAEMRLTYEDEPLNMVFVHGGFLPGIPWRAQGADIVTRIQVVDRDGRPQKRADAPDAPSWADLWCGPPFVVYGHTPRPAVHRLKWSLGLDTACVMGGMLSAWVLPERRVVQVKARQRYFP